MLGRNSYTREELDSGRSAVQSQLAAYRKLARAAAANGAPDKKLQSALENFEAPFFRQHDVALCTARSCIGSGW